MHASPTDETCSVCELPRRHYPDGDYAYCSEFCAIVSKKDADAFVEGRDRVQIEKARQLASGGVASPRDRTEPLPAITWYGVWPCAECGFPTEGEWERGAICKECAPVRRIRKMETLLGEAVRCVTDEDLKQRINEVLGK